MRIKEIANKEELKKNMTKLAKSSKASLATSRTNEVSVFSGQLTKTAVAENIAKLKTAFPALPPAYFKILSDRIIENNFTDERLRNAINNVIDNCVYPSPTIAQVISYDIKIRTYTYHELMKMADGSANPFELFTKVRLHPEQKKPVWVSNEEAERFDLERWQKP